MDTIGLSAPALPTQEELRWVQEVVRPLRVDGVSCHALDARYEPGSRCTVLYRLDGELLVGTVSFDRSPRGSRTGVRRFQGPTMEVQPFSCDPSLPGLSGALRPEILTPALNDAFSGSSSEAPSVVGSRSSVERYRPSRSCTLRLDVWIRDPTTGIACRRRLFGKLYPTPAKADAAHATMSQLAEITNAGSGWLRVAQPVAIVRSLQMVVQAPLPGTSMDRFLRRRAFARAPAQTVAQVRAAARALAELHALDLSHPRARPIGPELDRLAGRLAAAAVIDTDLDTSIGRLVDRLRGRLLELELEVQPGRMVHADCKPSQFLVHADGVGLLDFDHAGIADPALDVGMFMASLRQLGCRRALERKRSLTDGEAAWVREHETAFLEEYLHAAGETGGFLARVAWYESFGLLRKARRAMCRSVRSPLPRLLVDEAMECLDPRREVTP